MNKNNLQTSLLGRTVQFFDYGLCDTRPYRGQLGTITSVWLDSDKMPTYEIECNGALHVFTKIDGRDIKLVPL